MQSQDPLSELRGLSAVADAIRLRVQAELDSLGRSGTASPLQRACLTRARGHLELAQRALSETRPDHAPGTQLVTTNLKLPTLRSGGHGKRAHAPATSPRSAQAPSAAAEATQGDGSPVLDVHGQSAQPDAPTWAQRRVEEIGRVLDNALLEGVLDENKGSPHRVDGGPLGHARQVTKTPEVAPTVGADGPAPGSRPHFSGHTDVLSIPDLVGFFQTQSKTGVLEIQHASEVFRLEFEKGALLHAASSKSPPGERLGEILVRRGALTEARLPQLLAQLSRGERLGNALLRLDGVTQADLTAAVEEQVLGIFVRLAKLPGCSFTFHECTFERDLPGRVRHNVTRLLLDSARYLDDEAHALRESA